ncbi:DUF4153 domain-containing protein [Rhodococcus sp. NPDC003322]
MTTSTVGPPAVTPVAGPARASAWRPDRTSVAPPAAMSAALGAGVLAAALLGAPSIAYPLVGAAVVAAALTSVRPRPTRGLLLGCAAAVLLLAVAAVRDEPVLVALSVAASWLVASVALLGVRTWTGLLLAPAAPLCTPVRVTGWVHRGWARGRAGAGVRVGRVLVVSAVSVGLVAVFGSLFAAADPEFERLVGGVVPRVHVDDPVGRILLGAIVAAATLSLTYLRRQQPRIDTLAPSPGRSIVRWEWAVPLAALDLLFAAFVTVQARTLFGGDGHVLGTRDLTYAGYARQGFWQLCAVTALTLVVIAVAVRKADLTAPRGRTLARILLGALCLLSLVVVASALHRMSLYQSAFGYTRLRLWVSAAEFWFGSVFALLLVAGIRMRGRLLPRAVLASAVAALLTFAALGPDGHVADRNVERYERTGDIDVDYLRTLSVDAVPALDRLPEPLRSCALAGTGTPTAAPWYEFNAARARARDILRERPVDPDAVCAGPVVVG